MIYNISIKSIDKRYRYKIGGKYDYCIEIEDHMEFIEDGYFITYADGSTHWINADIMDITNLCFVKATHSTITDLTGDGC